MKPRKTTSKKKRNQQNKKSKSVTIQIPKKPMSVKIQTPKLVELRSGEDTLTPQRLVSVAGHQKSHLYIDSGASIYMFFNQELLGGLMKLDRAIKIYAGGKPIHFFTNQIITQGIATFTASCKRIPLQ